MNPSFPSSIASIYQSIIQSLHIIRVYKCRYHYCETTSSNIKYFHPMTTSITVNNPLTSSHLPGLQPRLGVRQDSLTGNYIPHELLPWLELTYPYISHLKAVGKMGFLSHCWYMSVPWRVRLFASVARRDTVTCKVSIFGSYTFQYFDKSYMSHSDVPFITSDYILKHCTCYWWSWDVTFFIKDSSQVWQLGCGWNNTHVLLGTLLRDCPYYHNQKFQHQ